MNVLEVAKIVDHCALKDITAQEELFQELINVQREPMVDFRRD